MAQIDLEYFSRKAKDRNSIHSKVAGTYSVFELNGQKYFQIDTFGKMNRKMPEKCSQSFQLDKKAAEYLINLLKHEFNLE